MRAFARSSQPVSWVLKSAGPVKVRPGRNEVSKNPFIRSTMPLYSGSRGGANWIRVASVPANAAAAAVTFPVPPIADSRSQTRVFVTRPICDISDHIPDNRSPPCREGSITAAVNRENPNVITSTGNTRSCPRPTGIRASGNHRSHCVTEPGP